MQTISVHVDDIQVGERHRAPSSDAVNRLAGSMKELGLMQPISVRLVEEMEVDGKMLAGAPVLVAGRHRLEAAKQLGWSHIDCVEVPDDPIQAELWEIAENLHRHDLTKEQRDQHIRRYAELIRQRADRLILVQNEPVLPKGPGQPKGLARQIADETGLSKSTVRRALNLEPLTLKSALEPETDAEAVIREANAVVSAWNRARQEARDLALEQIDMPVFDRTRAA